MSVFTAAARKLFKQPPEDELKDLKEELEEIVIVPSSASLTSFSYVNERF